MEDLEKQINMIISKVIDSVTDKYLKQLRLYIEKYVYQPNEPSRYERTGEFLDSFERLPNAKKLMGDFIQEIYFNPELLSYKKQNSGFWQHGINSFDFRDKMANILNSSEQNKTYSQTEWGALNVGLNGYYWEEFKKYTESHLINDIKSEFKKHGLAIY